ncbi:MAG: di-heme oxidoredictase family protein [Pseudomonadota bacterium]
MLTVSQGSYVLGFENGEDRPGGDTTNTRKINSNSFSHSSANLAFDQELDFKVGNGFFRRVWVSAPASTQASDGLGPLFNSRGCQRCHVKDGRGHPPLGNEKKSESLLLRLSIPPQTAEQNQLIASGRLLAAPDPVYGHQLQGASIQGFKTEGSLRIEHTPIPVSFKDGEEVILMRPEYRIEDLAYGPLHPEIRLSPRVAPQMIGLGLLEAIDEQDILSQADPDDADKDGISGRPNMVWSRDMNRLTVGRFGLKAGVATINEQNQGAFLGDIGMSTPMFPDHAGDCTEAQQKCRTALHGNSPQYENLEIPAQIVDLVLFYTRNLAVPARRNPKDSTILEGKQYFHRVGCAACHTPSYQTAAISDRPEHSEQLIWPYTDLLLHDMGDGLADGSEEGQANGREWRTPPLWGVGLTEVVNGHTRFLHDGRARNLQEAILWHGGEAENAKTQYMELSKLERQKLLNFVNSL